MIYQKQTNNVKATNTQFSSYRNFSNSIFNHRLPSKYLTMNEIDEEELKQDIDTENQINQQQINSYE